MKIFLIYSLSLSIVSISNSKYVESINTKSPQFELDSSIRGGQYFQKQFIATANFLDAAINSLNSFNSLIHKESYRIKVISFNNPTSSEMGFNLENEIQSALKPLLSKAKNVNSGKFSQVISSLITNQSKMPVTKSIIGTMNPIYSSLISLVGTLTIQEKKITKEDLDTFVISTSKYFVQYEKLNQANLVFDQNLDRIASFLRDLHFDVKEYMLDMITILDKSVNRVSLKNLTSEELLLRYFEDSKLKATFNSIESSNLLNLNRYPSDGIKTAKDIAYDIQKIFQEYQKIYGENFQQIKSILIDSKALGKNINIKQVDFSIKELELLYNESKNSDVLGLRLKTLFERLKILVNTEQSNSQN